MRRRAEHERRYAPQPSRMGTTRTRRHRRRARVRATPRQQVNAEAWRIMRKLVQARRECEQELRVRRGVNPLLYWSARRRSLDEAIAIVRGLDDES